MKLINVNLLKQAVEGQMDMQDTYLPAHFLDVINDQPTVEVVKCKDCSKNKTLRCPMYDFNNSEDYCSFYEREKEYESMDS